MQSNKKIVVVIPARYGSTRFPGKPLALIAGKPMIEWVYSRSCSSKLADKVIVATDHPDIQQVVESFGGNVVRTSPDACTGTDRVAEVVQGDPTIDIVVNVQGDEPLIEPACIDAVLEPLVEGQASVTTAVRVIEDENEYVNPHIVKVVTDVNGNALYFSRSPLPYKREKDYSVTLLGHIGIYGFQRDRLLQYVKLDQTPLEIVESLEQLRLLQNGINIKTILTHYKPTAVDIPTDIRQVEQVLRSFML